MKFILFPQFIRFIPAESRHTYACVTTYKRWEGYCLHVKSTIPGAIGATREEAFQKMMDKAREEITKNFLWLGAVLSDFEIVYLEQSVSPDGFVFSGDIPANRRIAKL